MAAVELTGEESRLKGEILKSLDAYHQVPHGDPRVRSVLAEMAVAAHALHISLKARGLEPRHTKIMRRNRGRHGLMPDHREFYEHLHPVEDLIKFLDDTNTNRDPEDQTLGLEFRFTVYSRRWKHTDDYILVRTSSGWRVNCNMYGGDCDKKGAPSLYESLEHDSINYPEDLGGYFEYLWEQASEEGLSKVDVQTAFDSISRWVRLCEENSPAGIFTAYK